MSPFHDLYEVTVFRIILKLFNIRAEIVCQATSQGNTNQEVFQWRVTSNTSPPWDRCVFQTFLFPPRCLPRVQPECLPCVFSPQASISWADNQSPSGPSDSCCWFQPLLCTQIAASLRSALGCLDRHINLTTAAWSLIKPAEGKDSS